MPSVVVTSPSFSRHATLRQELLAFVPDAQFHSGESVLSGQSLHDFLLPAEVALVGTERIDEALLSTLPQLRFIAKYGVGLDNIDLAACQQRGIGIGWTPGVNARSVAELTLCFMLGLTHNLFHTTGLLRQGTWLKRGGVQLTAKTVGIIGIGHVGREVIRLLAPLGCRILGNDIEDRSAFCQEWGVTPVSKEALYAGADIISLHIPLTEKTHQLINRKSLALFRPQAFLINTARGRIVDPKALLDALEGGQIAGAALDVFDPEPPTDRRLLCHPNLVASPHIGGNTEEAMLAMGRSAITHLKSHLQRPA